MNLPGYDAWKLATPPHYEMTPEQECELEDQLALEEQRLRDAIACALADERGGMYLATVRRVVVEELNKLQPRPGEPKWQSATPVPIPRLG